MTDEEMDKILKCILKRKNKIKKSWFETIFNEDISKYVLSCNICNDTIFKYNSNSNSNNNNDIINEHGLAHIKEFNLDVFI